MEVAFMRGGFSDDGMLNAATFLLFDDGVKLMDFLCHIQKFLTGHIMCFAGLMTGVAGHFHS